MRAATKASLLLFFAGVLTSLLVGAASPVDACGPMPACPESPSCLLRELSTPRDTRECKRTIDFGFSKFRTDDPSCLAERAANNAKIESERASIQLEHRQCLVLQESNRLKCDSAMSTWEACVSRVLPQFPPKSQADRRFMYQRCAQAGGKDEFTMDCCSHLYTPDRVALGVCQQRTTAIKVCRDSSHGVEQYSRVLEYSRTSPFMGGGFNQERWCEQVIAELRGQYPQANFEVNRRSETSKSVCAPFNCPNYQYTCSVAIKLEPVFVEKASPACR